MTKFNNRAYQDKLINDSLQAWADGNKVIMAVLPTGGGKTVCMSSIIKQHKGYGVAMVHRGELVSQISITLARSGIVHSVAGSRATITAITAQHYALFGRSYVNQQSADWIVASVDTVVSGKGVWVDRFKRSTLGIIDEGHHCLKDNKWGRCFSMLAPDSKGWLPTATPRRSDGKGLGSHSDGIADVLVEGPDMRALIDQGYLTDYTVRVIDTNDLDLSNVKTTGSGELSKVGVAEAVAKSRVIVGNVVEKYLQFASGKLGVTFAATIEEGERLTAEFNAQGVPAVMLTGDTPTAERAREIASFSRREKLMRVNVDLFGEGFDLPAIEIVIMARPTASFILYCLDPETEVLTPSGWLSHADALKTDSVIAFDMTTGECREVPVTGRVKRPPLVGESMYKLKSPHLDFNVSDKHNLIVKSRSSKTWAFNTAEVAAQRKSMMQIPVAANGVYVGSGLTDSELALLGWYLSDGGINKKNNALRITQACNKIEHIESIRNALIGCGFKYSERLVKRKNCPPAHRDTVEFLVSKGKPRGTDKHLTGWGRLEQWLCKSVPACYDTLTRDEFVKVLHTLNLGDGDNQHVHNYKLATMTIACGTNLKMANRLQALCVTRGFRCNMSSVQYEGYSMWHNLLIKDVQVSSIAGTGNKDGSVGGKKPYKRSRIKINNELPDFVWCLSNELGTLITRRNGKVAIMGNCQQFGRALRLLIDPELMRQWDTFTVEERLAHIAACDKPRAIIHDHVGNFIRHGGPPDMPQQWTLDPVKKGASAPSDAVPMTACAGCYMPFEKFFKLCPFCAVPVPPPTPSQRTQPETVDGDIFEVSAEELAKLRAGVVDVFALARIPHNLQNTPAAARLTRLNAEKITTHRELMDTISLWAGRYIGEDNSVIARRFYHAFGVDVLTAAGMNARDAETLRVKIMERMV